MSIKRCMYRAELKPGLEQQGRAAVTGSRAAQELVQQGKLMTAAAFAWEVNVFLYYECINEWIPPEQIAESAGSFLVDWPGKAEPRKWIPMIDVFHFNDPAGYEHWLRKAPVERRAGRVAHLKPEMMSSYIYYHYQLKEERAFPGEKYEMIAMHENMLFGYQEFPKVMEAPVIPGRLSTKGTPANWNDSRMDLHFQPWEDGHLYFKHIDQLFAYYIGDEKGELPE